MSPLTILPGDCRQTLTTLPAESVQCCVTSPPYFGLRDYGTGTWEGGSSSCDHIKSEVRTGMGLAALGEKHRGGGHKQGEVRGIPFSSSCGKCGAVRQDKQIGLEQTPEAFVAELVAVFREVRRALKKDGTLWVNLGDSYNASPGQRKATDRPGAKQATSVGSIGAPSRSVVGVKPKDLLGIPWMVAFALRADGWYLRQDIIWSKSNPMPETRTNFPNGAAAQCADRVPGGVWRGRDVGSTAR